MRVLCLSMAIAGGAAGGRVMVVVSSRGMAREACVAIALLCNVIGVVQYAGGVAEGLRCCDGLVGRFW